MRFKPSNRTGASRLWRLRLVSLAVALAAVAAVAVSLTGASSAKNAVGHAAANAKAVQEDGTLVTGTVPKSGKAAHGGTIVAGQLTGQTPTDIDPIINGATCSTDTFQFVTDMYIPLYYGPKGGTPQIDPAHGAAESPVYSDHDTTVTITIKPGLKWSDGSPVDGQDVAFFYYILKAATNAAPSNWCQYASPTEFPYNVKSISYSGRTVVMHLTHSVNPTWFTYNQLQDTNGGVYPLPATDWDVNSSGQKLTDWATNPTDALAIYNNLNNTNGADSPSQFATSSLWKVVDGGFKLQSFNTTNDSYVLVPNKSYGLSPKPTFTYDDNTYTSETALLDAMESGSVEIGQLDAATQLGSIPTLNRDGFSVFGAPEWGWFGGFINFKDTTDDFNKVAGQQYMRGVFAELINQKAIVTGVYHGWAVPAYGPVASAPSSPFVPSNVTQAVWQYSPKTAVATLKAHGWHVVPGGQTTCAKPGSAKDECGPGVPKGTPIKFVWADQPESAAAASALEGEAFESSAKSAGIDVTLQTKDFDFLVSNYNDQNPAAKKYFDDWGVNNYGGINTDYYPTEDGVMNTTGALNLGYYNNPTANKLMVKSTTSPSKMAIQREVAYFTKQQPVLYMPVQDWITAVSKKVGGTANGFLQMTQQQLNAALLWVRK
jgi:peptide/nickel transport system substrate-binding protein